MRITNSMLQRGALSSIQDNMQRIAEAQAKVSSGKRLQKASDDPTAAAGAMRARGSLRTLERFHRSVDLAESRTIAEEAALSQATDILARARSLAVSQSSGSATAQTRQHTKAEVDELFRHLVGLGNTQFEGTYLFGGQAADTPPITLTEGTVLSAATAPAGAQPHTVEIADKRFMAVNSTAQEAFADSGALQALQDLAQGLQDNDPDAIKTALGALDNSFSKVQDVVGGLGARMNQLELTRTGMDAVEVGLLEYRADLEEVNFEEAATELVSRQTALQAAMVATSRVMGLSLADYLR